MNLRKTAIEIHEKGLQFSESAVAELDVLEAAIQEIVQRTVEAFIHENLEDAEKIEPLEQVVDELVREMKARHIARLQNGECTIELGFILSDLLNNYERVADHCSNIAVALIEVAHDSFDTHEYLGKMKAEESEDFKKRIQKYRDRYVFPPMTESEEIK